MNNVDKKVGRKKAGTWGRTTGGYSPKAAKISKRAGSKGARSCLLYTSDAADE